MVYKFNPFTGTLDDIGTPVSTSSFVPYTGASQNVNLGEHGLTTNSISFNLTPTSETPSEGKLYWNESDGTLNVGMKGGTVNLQVGQEQLVRVRNNTGYDIANGKVVYISGALGNRPTIALADNDFDTAHKTLGLTTEAIDNNKDGFINISGLVRDLNTDSFAEGNLVFVGDTPGSLTNVEPISPKHKVKVGTVVKSHLTQGEILISVVSNGDLQYLDDVLITSPLNTQGLTYESTSGLWKNTTIDKTFVGLGNVTNVAQLPMSYLSTVTSLGTSDVLVPSQNAVKVYADSVGNNKWTAGTGTIYPTTITDLVGIGKIPTVMLDIISPKPADTAGATGIASLKSLTIVGGTGGTATAASSTGGLGSEVTITTGIGGVGTGATTNIGGTGGSFTLLCGNGGSPSTSASSFSIGGVGGAVNITAGNGGIGTNGGSRSKGGSGGGIIIRSGDAGNITSGNNNTSLTGGAIALTTGSGASSIAPSTASGTAAGAFSVLTNNGGNGNASGGSGGVGGGLSFTSGSGGSATADGYIGGVGGSYLFSAGTGGYGLAGTASGGAGANLNFTAGRGGNANGSGTGGSGGTIIFTGGTGGTSSSGTYGNGGNILFACGVAQGGAAVNGNLYLGYNGSSTVGKVAVVKSTTPTAYLHIGAGTATAGTAPLKLTSGTLLSNAEIGAVEFLTDRVYFSTADGSRKEIVLNDGTNLTAGRVPFCTTNGRLTDSSNITFATDTLTVSKLSLGAYERHIQIPAILTGNTANQPAPVDFETTGGLQFTTTGSKNAFCQIEVPNDWDGTSMILEVDWFPDSGAMSGTDTIEWIVTYRCIAEGETINNGTVATVTVTDSGDYSQYQTKHSRFTLPFNDANQPISKQDHIYFKITRNTAVANDFGGSVTVPAFEVIYNSVGVPTSN